MARLTMDDTTYMVLTNVFDYLTMGRDPHGVAWAAHPVKKKWLHGLEWRNKNKEDSEVGPHNVGCANESFVPPGVPQRWADLAPLLMLRFREFTSTERKQELQRALGHAGSAAEATLGFAIRVKSDSGAARGGGLRALLLIQRRFVRQRQHRPAHHIWNGAVLLVLALRS